jgi:phosphatidate cytidylyltransferase
MRRLYSALVLAPVLYGIVRYLPPLAFFGIVLLTGMLAVLEYYRFHYAEEELFPDAWIGSIATAAVLAACQWPGLVSMLTILLLTLLAAMTGRMASRRGVASFLPDTAILTFGALYVGLTLGSYLLLRSLPFGEKLIIFVILVTWVGDAGAYYCGMRWGHRPLAPVLSPKKTVEGLMGGLAASALTALIARAWLLPQYGIVEALALGLILGAVGTLGDLAESALKRSAGVKDSGAVIPAHGGMLDRIDSLLFTGPLFYYYVAFLRAHLTP